MLIGGGAALAVTGQLTQLAGTDGCVSERGSSGACADGRALVDPSSAAASPDGNSVYVTAVNSDAVDTFARDATTGRLTQLGGPSGCIRNTGGGGLCADGRALELTQDVAVSPDGKNVYVAAENGVAIFRRNTTSGALTQLAGTAGCVTDTGTATGGDTCADGKALQRTIDVEVSADGKNVYVVSHLSHALAIFRRNTTSGALTQLVGTAGCLSDTGSSGHCRDGRGLSDPTSVAVSADGKNVYATSFSGVSVFSRNPATGALSQLAGTAGTTGTRESGTPHSVAVSADDKAVYVAHGGVAVFRRNTTTGALSQLAGTDGCTTYNGSNGLCRVGRAIRNAISLQTSPDGRNVYLAAHIGAVAVFRRNSTSGALTQLAGTAGCVTRPGLNASCSEGKALVRPTSVTLSGDGGSVYVTSLGPASLPEGSVAVFAREQIP